MNKLIAENLKNDPRVHQAKRLLVDALADAQKFLTNEKEKDPDLYLPFDDQLKKMALLRGRPLYYPYVASGIGRGPLVELTDGSVKYDFITGIGVHYLGHSHLKLLESSIDAALEDTIMQGNLQQSAKSIELLEKLIMAAASQGASLKHAFLTSSGAMANENAFKIIFQKNEPAHRLLAFERCFSGRSLATAQMTDKPANREGIPKIIEIDYVPFFDSQNPKKSTKKSVDCLKSYLKNNPKEYAGMCFELIQGEGGYYPGEREFFVSLMKILKDNNVAVMIDEIQTFGRTSELFAFQLFELDQYIDVVSIGKMTQICATIFTEEYNPKAGLLSQTFTSSTSAIYASCVILDELTNGGYLGKEGKINQCSRYFMDGLANLSSSHPEWIQGPFGFGTMIGFTPFDGSTEKAKLFLNELYDAGVLGFIAGKSPARVRFLIPVGAVSFKDIDAVCRIIEKTLEKVAACS